MSSKKRGSSTRRKTTKQTQPAEALLGGLAKNPALAGILVLIVLIVGAFYYFVAPSLNPDTATEEPNNESAAGQIGRSTPDAAPNEPVSGLGSGGQSTSAWYELHFNSPTYPNKKENNVGGMDTYLVSLINKATQSVDMAIYDFDLMNVAEAMAAAKNRGVTVRMVTDSDTLNNKDEAIQAALNVVKKAKIPIVDDNRGPIMHNKFTVVDGEWVQTGSWNYTTGDTYRLNNHMIIIRNKDLARNYTNEFKKMFENKQFGPNKSKDKPFPVLTISGVRVENYFSAEDAVTPRLVELVNSAKQSVYFLAFSFTEDTIGDAMINRAKAGVKVQGVFEKTGSDTKFSEYGRMKTAGLDVYTDGNPYVMHHKVIIVDERTVVFGSFNFSQNAEKSNDENMLIVEDPTLAKAFLQEYNKILELAKNPPKRK